MMEGYNTNIVKYARGLTGFVFLFLGHAAAHAQQAVDIPAAADNAIYSESGDLSNGSGDHLFAGRNNSGNLRRALVRFDFEGMVPEGAAIDSVFLGIQASRGRGNPTFTLHGLLSSWGEGESNASGAEGSGASAAENDVTWQFSRFDQTTWSTPGGDFEVEPSASYVAPGLGSWTWPSTPEIVDDVRNWLADPQSNFGWIIRGDEANNQSAFRFSSRENPAEESRPSLRIVYSVPTASVAPDLPNDLQLEGIYPNPFSERTTIRYRSPGTNPIEVTVFDMLGRSVYSTRTAGLGNRTSEVRLEAGGLPDGAYIIRVRSGDQTRIARIIKAEHNRVIR